MTNSDTTNNNISPAHSETAEEQMQDVDDVTIESYNDDLDDGSLSTKDTVKRLREKIATLTKEKQSYMDGWQRLKADFVNYKNREQEERAEFLKFAKVGIVSDLIPVLDSFTMAFSNKDAWEKVEKNWRTGVEYIHQQLLRVLEEQGLKTLNPVGERFDPNLHTSVGSVATDDEEKNHTIATVVQTGYMMNDKIIKSPTVTVFEKKELSQEQ